jgi:hypothetical protein
MSAREVLRLTAVRQCCPGKTDCSGDCQGHLADQQLAALDAVGLAVVPKEPTVEMLTAGTEEWLTVRAMEDRAAVIWRAMLVAWAIAMGAMLFLGWLA